MTYMCFNVNWVCNQHVMYVFVPAYIYIYIQLTVGVALLHGVTQCFTYANDDHDTCIWYIYIFIYKTMCVMVIDAGACQQQQVSNYVSLIVCRCLFCHLSFLRTTSTAGGNGDSIQVALAIVLINLRLSHSGLLSISSVAVSQIICDGLCRYICGNL